MRSLLLIGGLFTFALTSLHAGEPARDAYLSPLPKGAKVRLGMGADRVNNVTHNPTVVSPDGKLLAASIGTNIFVWDLAAGKVIQSMKAYPHHLRGIVFLDNDTLLSQGRGDGFNDVVKKWSPRTGKLLGTFDVPENWAGTAFSRDGTLLALTTVGDPNVLNVYDTVTGKQLFRDNEHYPTVFFSHDSKLVVTSRQHRIKYQVYDTIVTFRDARTGNVVRKLEIKDTQGSLNDISPDGKLLVGHVHIPHAEQNKWRSCLQLFDAETGKLVRTLLEQRSGDMKSAVFSHDGKLVTSVNQNEHGVSVWDVATGEKRATFSADGSFFNFPRFLKDGRTLVNTTASGRVFLHDLTTGTTRDLNPTHRGQLIYFAFTPDGKHLASAGHLSEIFLWDTAKAQLVNRCDMTPTYDGNKPNWQYAMKIAFAPDGRHLLVQQQSDYAVRLYDPFRGCEFKSFRDAGHVWGFSEDGRTLVWTGVRLDLIPRLHNAPKRVDPNVDFYVGSALWATYAMMFPEIGQFRCKAYFSPPAEGEWARPTVTNFLGGMTGQTAMPHAISPDGSVVTTWIMHLAGRPDTGMGQYWVPSGMAFWDTSTGHEITRFMHATMGHLGQLFFAPDSRSFIAQHRVAQERGGWRLYELRTGKERLKLSDASSEYGTPTFSRDGRYFAFVDPKNAIIIFDLTQGKVAATIPQTDTNVRLAFSPNNSLLASGGASATILLWDLKALLPPAAKEPAWTDAEKTQIWNDLALPDAAASYAAMMRLKRSPEQAIALLTDRLQWRAASKDMSKLIDKLGSGDFKTRKAATDALEQLGERARPSLLKALPQASSLEHKRRIEGLLGALGKPFTTPTGLRILRAIEVLDGMRTPEAAALLRELAAETPPDDPVAREVARALERAGR